VALFAGASLPALSASGHVVDPAGRPVPGARACLMVAGREGLCVETDERGYFSLLPSRIPSVRIRKTGYLPVTIASVDQEAPIVLAIAAAIEARLFDADTGEPIDEGKLMLRYSSGFQRGPFPVRAAGLLVRTIEPGTVVPVATAEGYAEARGTPLDLPAGATTEITLRLKRN